MVESQVGTDPLYPAISCPKSHQASRIGALFSTAGSIFSLISHSYDDHSTILHYPLGGFDEVHVRFSGELVTTATKIIGSRLQGIGQASLLINNGAGPGFACPSHASSIVTRQSLGVHFLTDR